MPDMPERIGRYEVLSLLGQGGMGVLYLARDPVIDRHVALKLLKVDSDDLRRRFVREARSAGRLQHPNIVTVYDVGDHDGELFIAMEYIDGDTLATLIRDDVPFSTLRKLEMLDQLADGLGFAHHRGIVHRDVKPANVMVTRGGLLKVLDFGIARITRHDAVASVAAGTVMGTPAYMAPEQLEGAEIDHRADIFAVGLVIYELLSGRRAFVGASTADVLQKVLTEEPPPIADVVPTIDPDLVRCVARALAKRPEDRYQDLQDLRNDLGRVRRRVELESGSFDATVIVQVPAALRQPAGSSTPTAPPVPPTPPPPGTPPRTPPGGQGVTTSSAGTSEPQTGTQPGPFDAEAEALRHMATRGSQPVRLSVPLDETIVAPLVVPPADSPAAAASEAPPVTPPALPSQPSVPPGAVAGAATPASAPRRSVVPALIAVGVIVLVLAVGALGALWWLRGRLLDRFAAATTVAEQTPGAVEGEADRPSTSTDAAIAPASPGQPAEPTMPPPAEAAPVAAPPGPTAAAASEGQASPSQAPSAAAVARRDDRTTPPAPAPSSGRAVANSDSAARRAAPSPAPETPVAAPPVVASARPETPSEAVVARDEALELVRAYVAARNTGHAAGLRRIWPSVSDLDVRRMTSEFSAPLTLTACDVEAAGPARMRATCRFTQPGTTGFSEGTTLTIRRQLVFAMERQGRSWVVADVTG